jgi:hypothetical protein
MANSMEPQNLPSNLSARTNKELIGCRVIRGTDWKWGKQVRRTANYNILQKIPHSSNSIQFIPRWPKINKRKRKLLIKYAIECIRWKLNFLIVICESRAENSNLNFFWTIVYFCGDPADCSNCGRFFRVE